MSFRTAFDSGEYRADLEASGLQVGEFRFEKGAYTAQVQDASGNLVFIGDPIAVRSFVYGYRMALGRPIVASGTAATRAAKLERCARVVNAATGVHLGDINSRSRTRHIADARHLLFWLLIRREMLAYSAVAGLLDVNHTSVMHGVGKIENLVHYEPELRAKQESCDRLWAAAAIPAAEMEEAS